MEREEFCKIPEYKWLETKLVKSGIYRKTYQTDVPFLHFEIPKLVSDAIGELRAEHKSESNEWVIHHAIYEAALKYLKVKKLNYPFQSPPQYGTAEMFNGFQNIAPAPTHASQQTVSGDEALNRENLMLREVIDRKDQEIHEKEQELERKHHEIQKKDRYISSLMELAPALTPTPPVIQQIVGTDEQVNQELQILREGIEGKDQEIHEKDLVLQRKDNEIQKKDRYISSLMETLNAAQDVINSKLNGFAL